MASTIDIPAQGVTPSAVITLATQAKADINAVSAPACFMAGDVGTSATTKYLPPGYIAVAPTVAKDMPVAKAMTIKGMRYSAATAHTGSGSTVIVSVRKNGSPESLALIVAAGVTTGDTIGQDPVSFAAGDTFGLQVDKGGTVTASPLDMAVTLDIS